MTTGTLSRPKTPSRTNAALHYGFAFGRLAALRSAALDDSFMQRLIEAPDATARQRILSESPYRDIVNGAHDDSLIGAALKDEYRQTCQRLARLQLPQPVVDFFALMQKTGQAEPVEPAEQTDASWYAARLMHASRSGSTVLVALTDKEIELANARIALRLAARNATPATCKALLVDVRADNAHLVGRCYSQLYHLCCEGQTVQAVLGEQSFVQQLANALVKHPAYVRLDADDLANPARLDLVCRQTLRALIKRQKSGDGVGLEPLVSATWLRLDELERLHFIVLGAAAGIARWQLYVHTGTPLSSDLPSDLHSDFTTAHATRPPSRGVV